MQFKKEWFYNLFCIHQKLQNQEIRAGGDGAVLCLAALTADSFVVQFQQMAP